MDIKKKIQRLIRKYKTNDPFELCDYLNISIIFVALPEEIKGIYQLYKNIRTIYINNSLGHREQKVVCSHELGHAILHRKMNIVFLEKYTLFSGDKFEIEADEFAAELLIPDHDMKHYYGTGDTIQKVAEDTSTNTYLVELKIKNSIKMTNDEEAL